MSLMKAIISTSEIVAEVSSPYGPAEVHATAEGTFDSEHSEVSVTLDSQLRPRAPDGQLPRPAWLPSSQIVKERVSAEEATLCARDIFQDWAERVRRAVPVEILHGGLPQV